MDAVLNWLWQGGVVAVASFVMLLALERARANVRWVVCWAAALAVIALPALASLQSTAVSAAAFGAPRGDAIVSLPDTWWTSTLVLLAAWTVWTSIHIVRFASAVATIRRARARSRAFPTNVESILPHWCSVRSDGRHATLVLSDAVATAAVLGWGAPMIAVAPSLVTTLDADELDRILIHEWAHVQRRDDLVNVLQIVVRTIAGWHPALWWIDRRLQVEREIACDEIAVAITGSPKSYAECLVKLASLRGATRAMQAVPGILTSSGLGARVIKIVSTPPSIAPAWSRSIAAAIVTTLGLTSLGVGGLKLVEAAALTLPFVSPRTLSSALDRVAPPMAVPMLSSDMKTDHSPRRIVARVPSARRSQTEQPSPVRQSKAELDARRRPRSPQSADAAPAEADPQPPVAPVLASVPRMPAERSDVAAEQPPNPWTAAAAGGVALGRKSKDAGVATGGFFTRFARRVAGSF